MTGKRPTVLDALSTLIPFLARQMEQHREARTAFDKRADRRAMQAKDEAAFPVPRGSPGPRPLAAVR